MAYYGYIYPMSSATLCTEAWHGTMVDDLGVWPKVVGHSHARTVASRVKRSCASNPERVLHSHCPQTSCVGWEHLLLVSGAGNPGIIGHSGEATCLQPWQLALGPPLAVELQMPTQAKPTAMCRSSTASRATTENIAAGAISIR